MQQQMDQLAEEHAKEVNSLQQQARKSKERLEEEKSRSVQYSAFLAVDGTRAATGSGKTPTDIVVEHIKVEMSVVEKKVWKVVGI